MNAGDWIALYAAAAGTGGLVWQAVTYRTANKPRLAVRLALVLFAETREEALSVATRPTDWQAEVELLNIGRARARVASIAVTRQEASADGTTSWSASEWGLPWWLEPGESRTVVVRSDQAGPLGSATRLRAHAHTDSGEHVMSEPIILNERSEHVLVAVRDSVFRELGLSGRVRRHEVVELTPTSSDAADIDDADED